MTSTRPTRLAGPQAARQPGTAVPTYRLTAEGITDVELPKRPNEQLDLFDDE